MMNQKRRKNSMNFTEAFETLTRLYEGVSPENPFLAKALPLYKQDSAAKGIIVSVKKDGSGNKEEEIGKTYHSTAEFDKIMSEIYRVYGTNINVSAIHDRGLIKEYEKELDKLAKETEGQAATDSVPAKKVVQDTEKQTAEVQKEQPAKPKTTAKYTPAQLTTMRQNNNKIISATKIAGLDISPLVTTGTDKNGRQYKKASPALNKLRKTLFGESKKE